jgi:hypothetical protein
LIATTIINTIFITFFFIKKTKNPKKEIILNFKNNYLIIILCLMVFLIYFFNFKGLGLGYWDTYIILPAALMTNSHVNLIDLNEEQLYEYTLPGFIPDNLVNEGDFGISTKDQRIGSAIFFSLPYLFFGKIGFRIFFALTGLLLFVFGYIFARNVFNNYYLSIFSGLLLSINPYILSVNRLNPNILGLLLLTFIFCIITEKKPSWLLVGICFGILGGIRNIAILFIPALLFVAIFNQRLKLKPKKTIIKILLLFFIGSFIFIIPILMWNNFAFGNMLEHPTQSSSLYGFRPAFEHSILGANFEFNGLLNYPFIDNFVRTPHFLYPTFLTIPLTIISSFGILLFALVIFGIVKTYKDNKYLFVLILLFSIPFFLFLIFQENWEDVKTTFILLLFSPLVYFITAGLMYFLQIRKKVFLSNTLKILVVMVLIILTLKSVSHLEFEKDVRWFERFPEAKNNKNEVIFKDLNMRDEWQFFNTDETTSEMLLQKKILTKINILPAFNKIKINIKIPRNELKNSYNLTLIDVWKYIY